MRRLTLLPPADEDFARAAQWYEDEGAMGGRFIEAVLDAISQVERHPKRYPLSDAYEGPAEVRRIHVEGFSYIVIYQITESELLGISVCHVSRDQRFWLDRVQ